MLMSLITFYYIVWLKLSTCTHVWYKEKPSIPLEPEQTWLHPENEQWLVRGTEERQGCMLAGSESGWGEKRRRGEGKGKRLINSVLGVENCRQKFLCATASLNPNATESSARAWIRSHQGIISLCVHVYAKVCVYHILQPKLTCWSSSHIADIYVTRTKTAPKMRADM